MITVIDFKNLKINFKPRLFCNNQSSSSSSSNTNPIGRGISNLFTVTEISKNTFTLYFFFFIQFCLIVDIYYVYN